MNNKLLLVNGITLLYRESQLPTPHENSSELIREIVNAIRLPEITVGINREKDIMEGLRQTAITMCNEHPDHRYEPEEILQRLKVNTLDEEGLYEAFHDGIAKELKPDALKRTCLNLKRTLAKHFQDEKIQDIVQKAAFKLKFERSKITDMKLFVSGVMEELRLQNFDGKRKDPAIISEIDVGNLVDSTRMFSNVKQADDGTSIMRIGWQGVNRMFDGGLRRGEQVVVTGPEHSHKTGVTLGMFKAVALYNTPVMIDPTRKPMLLSISCEDSAELNFQFLFQSLKENETGEAVDLSKYTSEDMAAYVMEKLQATGYHVRIIHINPGLWTYMSVQDYINDLEAEGYEIHLCRLDYLLKIPTTGCTGTAGGEPLRNMFERLRDFFNSKKIAFLTPHQMSADAKLLIRDGRQDLVKQVVKGAYYAGSKQLGQVIDLEVFINIEIVNGASYMTIQRGKHRKIKQTPASDLYCVIPFNPIGGLRDDINGPDSTRKKVGGGVIGSGEEVPFWDFDNAQ